MKIEIEISELAERMFGDRAKRILEQVAQDEAMRLWHIERSQPKDKRAAGRPRLTDDEKLIRALGLQLRGIYLRLKELYGPDFEKAFGEQEAQLEKLIEEKDLDGLVKFNTEHPWIRRKVASNSNS
jgi:hypothetical protein